MNGDSIEVVSAVEMVRKRPNMYIGETSSKGIFHLFLEMMEYVVKEHQEGACMKAEVLLSEDGNISISCDGSSLSFERLKKLLTVVGAGGKFRKEGEAYTIEHFDGLGFFVVNALSQNLTVCVQRDGIGQRLSFSQGSPMEEQEFKTKISEYMISFIPDSAIFKDSIELNRVQNYLEETAVSNKKLSIDLIDERDREHVIKVQFN